jgi:tRNA1Val (adenine37-N6)-methyltransferase
MKVGTDAMLLGAWAPAPRRAGHPPSADLAAIASDPSSSSGGARVLDVGTGTGVLALMAAQKGGPGCFVDAIDVDAAAARQAALNAAGSAFAARVAVHHASLQRWVAAAAAAGAAGAAGAAAVAEGLPAAAASQQPAAAEGEVGEEQLPPAAAAVAPRLQYDCIITNPPYFQRSSKPERCARRAAARHADGVLPFPVLAAGCAALLRPGGSLCLVLPPAEGMEFLREAVGAGLVLAEATRVFTRAADDQPKRLLMRLAKPEAGGAVVGVASAERASSGSSSGSGRSGVGGGSSRAPSLDELCESPVTKLVIRRPAGDGGGQFSDGYRQLTEDFHHPDYI